MLLKRVFVNVLPFGNDTNADLIMFEPERGEVSVLGFKAPKSVP